MSHFKRNGNSKQYRIRKANYKSKKDRQNKYRDTKGNWEYSIFQKRHTVHKEANIKQDLGFVGGFDPKKIDDLMNPPLTKKEVNRFLTEHFRSDHLAGVKEVIYKEVWPEHKIINELPWK